LASRLRPVGRNRLADAALFKALELPDVDAICLVSDGAPDSRDALTPEELVLRAGNLNYFKTAYIHTAALIASADYKSLGAVEKVTFDRERDRTVKMLEEIAARNGGVFYKLIPE